MTITERISKERTCLFCLVSLNTYAHNPLGISKLFKESFFCCAAWVRSLARPFIWFFLRYRALLF